MPNAEPPTAERVYPCLGPVREIVRLQGDQPSPQQPPALRRGPWSGANGKSGGQRAVAAQLRSER